jgi:hypothetical protein
MRFLARFSVPILAGLLHLVLSRLTLLGDLYDKFGKGQAVKNRMQDQLDKLADQVSDLANLSQSDAESLTTAFRGPAKEVEVGQQAGRRISWFLVISGVLLAFPVAWLVRTVFKIGAAELFNLWLLILIALHLTIVFFATGAGTPRDRLTEFGQEVYTNTALGKVSKLLFRYYPAFLITLWAILDETMQTDFWQPLFTELGTAIQGTESLISVHEAMRPIYTYGYPIIGSLALVFALRVVFLRWVFGKRLFKVVVYKPKEQRRYRTAYYQCGNCGKQIPSKRRPLSCPHCGVSFGREERKYDTPPKPTVRKPPREVSLARRLGVTVIFMAVTLVFVVSALALPQGRNYPWQLALAYNAIPAVIALFAAGKLARKRVGDEITIEQEVYYEGDAPPE